MDFKRARNEENKKIRMEQIKEAAVKLLDRLNYHEISLSKIGNEINFTRGNLYKYVKSKEDIYIYVLIDEIQDYLKNLYQKLDTASPLDAKILAHIWGETLEAHPRYIKLLAFLFPILERNASIKVLVDLKKFLISDDGSLIEQFRFHLPEFSALDVQKLFDITIPVIMSRYHLCHLSENIMEANKISGYEYRIPKVSESFAEAALYAINGIKLSKMIGDTRS